MEDFDFDVSLLDDKETNGVYLTKVEYEQGINIKATYHEFKDGVVQEEYVEDYDDLHINHKELNKMKYSTVLRIIEINDKPLYDHLDKMLDRMMGQHKEYVFSNICSSVSIIGCLAIGYAIANMNYTEMEFIITLLASIGLITISVLLKNKSLMDKIEFDIDAQNFRDYVSNNTRKFNRVKKRLE